MTLWLAARRAPYLVALIVTTGPLVILSGDSVVPILAIVQGQAATPLALLAPLVVAVGIGWSLSLGDPAAEATAVRATRALDGAYAATVVTLGAAACIATAIAGAPFAAAGARNVVALSGLTLVGRWLLGREAATAVPAGVALISALLGTTAAGQVYAWAWVADPTPSTRTWLFSIVVLTLGLCVTAAGPRTAKLPD